MTDKTNIRHWDRSNLRQNFIVAMSGQCHLPIIPYGWPAVFYTLLAIISSATAFFVSLPVSHDFFMPPSSATSHVHLPHEIYRAFQKPLNSLVEVPSYAKT
jgi:hypothetical protein